MKLWNSSLVLLLLMFLLGCDEKTVGSPPPLQKTEATAKNSNNAALDLVSASSESYDGRPSIVLQFSHPLVSQQAFDQFLALKVKDGANAQGSWILENGNKKLRFPYVEADKTFLLTIKAGLSTPDGKTIAKEFTQEIYSGLQEPLVGFASQGNILPAHETRGLPIVTLNVTEVDLDFFKIDDSKLGLFLNQYQQNGRQNYWDIQQISKFGASVYANRFALQGNRNERSVSYIPVRDIDELATPGLYFAVLKGAGQYNYDSETAIFLVSDIGLHTRAYKDQTLVLTTSLKTGKPKAGVSVEVRNEKSETVFKVISDEQGLALIEYKPNQRDLLTARFGKDVSVLPFNQPALDLSEFSLGGRAQAELEIFSWSGRDLYRPGEMLGVNALLRDFDGKAVKPQPVYIALKQPDGRALATQQLEPGDLNEFRYERQIPLDAPTGKWSLELSTSPTMVQATSFSFRVEEFLPERLKLSLDAPAVVAPGDPLPLSVEGAWLYGSPAKDKRFTARLSLQPDSHPIEALKEFHFGDPLTELPKQPKDVLDKVLDENGKLSAEIALDDAKTPAGPVAVIIVGSLYESGGRAVTRAIKRTVWPASEIIGARPLFEIKEGAIPNGNANFEILRSNAQGELLAAKNLKVRLLRENRSYSWRWVNGSGWQTDFISNWTLANEQKLDIQPNERVKLSLPVEWGGYRLEVFDPETALTMRLPFEAGWGWYNEGQQAGSRPDKVKLALDKTAYKEDDTVKLTIKPPHSGHALITLESDQLLWQKQIECRGETTIEIPLKKEWMRHDLYVNALVFRPGSSAEKITPSRAVGLVHIPLDRSLRKSVVTLHAAKKIHPDETLDVAISAPAMAGQHARVALHAVDVGILNLTQFALPDPAGWFFAPRRFVTEAYDIFGRIIEALDGNKARLRYGGDAALLALPQARRPNVKVLTVDMYENPIVLDAEGNARFKLKLPDFNGTVRLTAIAYSDQNYGVAEQETIIQAPLVVEVSTPRVMASGDHAEIAVDLENLSGKEGSYNIHLDAADDMLSIEEAKRSVKLADKARSTQIFKITAREKFGVVHVSAKVKGSDLDIERHLEFALRPAYPAEHRSRSLALDQGGDISPDATLRSGLLMGSTVSRITLGTLPPLPFASVVKDLIDYPYGCVEQTTSKAFPLLFLDADTAQRFGVQPLAADARQNMLNVAFSRLASMQTQNGHFNFWPGDSYVVTHITPYVGEMLVTAKEAGFAPDEAMLEKTLKRLNDDLLAGGNPHYEYEYSEHLRIAEQAHAGYVLAKLKRAPLGTLRAIFDNDRAKLIAPLPFVHLGLALTLQGDPKRGNEAITEAFSRKFERPRWIGDYGSTLRDLSLMVAMLNENGLGTPEYNAKVYDMAREYMGREPRGRTQTYLSTQEQIAIFRLGRALMGNINRKIEGDIKIGALHEPFAATAQIARSFVDADLSKSITLSTRGEGPIFVVEDVVGYPAAAPKVQDENVSIRRTYYRQDGTEYDGAPLTTGEILLVSLDISAKEKMNDALIIDLAPGGLELENPNLGDQSAWDDILVDNQPINARLGEAYIRFEEYRDDRYVAAVQLYSGQKSKLFYILRAVSPGKYKVPTPLIEDMYRPTIRGIGSAFPAMIEVKEPQ